MLLWILIAISGTVTGWHFMLQIANSNRIISPDNCKNQFDYALVLGAGHYRPEHWTNYILIHRIDQAEVLLKNKCVNQIIVSGRRINEFDDEAGDMRIMLLERGIGSSSVILDPKGFRTWVSVQNLKGLAEGKRVIIISQKSQLERALMAARCMGIDARGVIAQPSPHPNPHLERREFFARMKVLIDCVKYLLGFSN
jgi:SanA protein